MRANQGSGHGWARTPIARRAVAALALAAALSSSAHAGGPGPDVIVGALPDTFTYGTVGSSGLFAYDLGTVSCNAGNVNLRWQAGTPLHPVIAQNVFRLKDGRFEQVGLSWAKHGFFALGQSLCSACSSNAVGSVLAVGCSDPYDSGLNGTQQGLGPRSEINPATGQFPFNYAAWPPITDDLSRRIQIPQADVDPAQNAGAQYFGEAVYVAPDDAQAGNGWNNASYRRMSFGPAPFFRSAFAAADPTVREKPAIFAWPEADPGVRLAGVDVPGDGRFFLAVKVTDLGAGQWRYHYALYNLNADRAAGALTLPLPPGAGATDAAVRIVPYHSGEPYTNEAWTTAILPGAGAPGSGTNGSVTFSVPKAFAQDPSTSALRWGTMHTFGFTSTAPPADGAAAIGLFKPGAGPAAAVASVAVAIPTPGGVQAPVSALLNTACASPQPLHAGENRVSIFGAGTSRAPTTCAPAGADAWFSYTYAPYAPSCPGSVTFTLCAGAAGASMTAYAGPNCPASAADELGCVLSSAACTGRGVSISTPAVSGRTYLLRVRLPEGVGAGAILTVDAPVCVPPIGACCRSTGQCTLTPGSASCFDGVFQPGSAACNPNPCQLPPPPSNDLCTGAIALGDTLAGAPSVPGNNVLAANDLFESCPEAQFGQKDVWYVYTPARPGEFVADTCQLPQSGDPMDTTLSVRQGSCTGPVIACNDDDPLNGCAGTSRVVIQGTAGTPYYLRVAGYAGTIGEFVIRVRGGGGLPLTVAGACCRGSTCALSVPSGCAGPGARFAGVGAACNAPGVPTAPCCYADFDASGVADILDIFAFLTAWFDASPRAVFGGDGTGAPALQDIFAFLTAWFAGGC